MRDRDPPPGEDTDHLEHVEDGDGCIEVAEALAQARREADE